MICFLIAIDVKEAEIQRQISEMYGANVMNNGMVQNGKAFKIYGFENVYWEVHWFMTHKPPLVEKGPIVCPSRAVDFSPSHGRFFLSITMRKLMIIFKAKWLGGETWVANPTPKSKQQSMKYDRIQHKT